LDNEKTSLDELDTKAVPTLPGSVRTPLTAFESPVDPEEYFLGPSDILSVNLWISPPVSFTLTVTPEGTLIIPTVGEIHVEGLPLARAKELVRGEVRKKYVAGETSVTLIVPRPIVVMVTGHVLMPGLYELTAVDRAHRAIEEANKMARPDPEFSFKELMARMSTRNVVLKHRDGTISRVDIDMFLATREEIWNPFLREGDVVIVPRKSDKRNLIGVYGEVNLPGRYEFVPGDSLEALIELAQGFTRHARLDSVLFYRLDRGGSNMTTRVVDVEGILQGQAVDVALEPGDRVVIQSIPDFREDYRVTVLGQVLQPGTYPITRNTTRLSEIIRRAGDFTEFASLHSAYVSRNRSHTRGWDLDSLQAMRGRRLDDDFGYFVNETEIVIRQEYVSVDFVKLFVEQDSTQDILLQSEDTVYVPSMRNTVYVYGQVLAPGHIPYTPGRDVSFYIQRAGGFGESAQDDNVQVVKAKNRQWLNPEETAVEEGDYIWVPRDPERPFGYYLGIVAQSAAIVSVAMSVIILATQAGR
jgi:protein involved in polysaccharide export with SLBB domain